VASSSVALASAIVDRGGRTWTIEELTELVSRAMADEASALATLKTSFDARQSWWDRITDSVAEQAEESLIKASATKELWRLAARRRLERTRDGLAGPSPTPLVRLAARSAALCSLEADLAHRSSANSLSKNLVPSEAEQRWLDRADGRFRKALKTLADLQRLQRPADQVNAGSRQVNIATGQVDLPGSAGGPAPATVVGSPRPVIVTAAATPGTALPSSTLPSSTTATGSQTKARSRGRRGPADAATQELGEYVPSPSESAGTALGRPDEFLPSECPTSGTGGTMRAAGGTPPRPGAPCAPPGRAARGREPVPQRRREIDPRRAGSRGTRERERVEHDAVERDELAA
jgi:hypothetical protein